MSAILNPFVLVLVAFPTAVVISSILGTLLSKKVYVMTTLVFATFLILTFTVFNSSFLIWVVVYTLLAFIVSLLTKVLIH